VQATVAVTPVLTPTPFASTSRNCLDDLKITSPALDQPAGLVLRIVQLQATGLSPQQRTSDVTVSSRGMVRDATWLFFPEILGQIATLNGRFEPEICSTWTMPSSLIDQVETALRQPAFLDLRESDLQQASRCMDSGGFVLRSGSRSTQKELYIIECHLETPSFERLLGSSGVRIRISPPHSQCSRAIYRLPGCQ
jgi:hypothetical protein